jgi:hypothetical protein
MPRVSGVTSTVRGEGGGEYASVIAETVVADAGAGAEILDANPRITAATKAITAQPRDRVT